MPQFEKPDTTSAIGYEPVVTLTMRDRVNSAIGFLRRQYWIVLICLLLALPIGAWYHFTGQQTYSASATMMIETRKSPIPELLLDSAPDAGWIESQVGILRSQNIAAYVVKQLRLAEDPEFARSAPSLLDKLLIHFGLKKTPDAPSEAERISRAVGALVQQLDVRRVGLSYIMRIDVRWHNPDQATKIANAMVDAYVFEQLNAKYQANRRASDWLQERLQTLREQTASAERAVIEFKSKNNIVKTGGALMNEKQLTDISTQLGAARAHTADLQLRYDRIAAVRRAYQEDQPAAAADETVTEAMNNPIINGFRTRYLELTTREASWSAKYGKNHVAVVNLRNQIHDIRRSIADELGRIEETAKSELEIAKKRQGELDTGMASLVSQSTETNQAQVTLFSLEATAQSYRKIYDNFLQRHTESLQQQTYPISDARLLSPASGAFRNDPPELKIWLATIFAGLGLGIGFGVFREKMDCVFRTREQVRSVLETECLALVPLVTYGKDVGKRALPRKRAASLRITEGASGRPDYMSVFSAPKFLRSLIEAPSSPHAEAIRSIKLALDLSDSGKCAKVVGLTSCSPSEGKSTLAASMAMLAARGGARVILVDCDLRNPSLSRLLAPNATVGFLDVAVGKVPLADAVWRDASTNLTFLPTVSNPQLPNVAEIMSSAGAQQIFDALEIDYDYVIVDLSPLVATIDVRASSRFIDSFVLVIEWGSTKVDAVQYALRNAPDVHRNMVGAVLNKVDMPAMHRYDSYGAAYYYSQKRHVA